MTTEHLSETTMAAYVDARLPRAERRQADAHMANCGACREELVAVSDLVSAQKKRSRTWIPLTAAASIALVAIALGTRGGGAPDPLLRGGDEPAPALEAALPAPNAVVSLPARFVWRRAADALEYRVTVTDAAGGIVAERVTVDTTVDVVVLPPGPLRWNVTAILANGSVLSTGLREFTAR